MKVLSVWSPALFATLDVAIGVPKSENVLRDFARDVEPSRVGALYAVQVWGADALPNTKTTDCGMKS
jgi:hypothetical protein